MKKQIIPIAVSLIMFVGCMNNTKEKFERAKQLNTISVYETFIKENYESKYADSALVKLQGLEFRQAITIEDYEKFKRKYTQSTFLDSVSAKIHILKFKDLGIEKPLTDSRVKELNTYLANHPTGFYAKQIKKIIDSLNTNFPPPPPKIPRPELIEVVEDDIEIEEIVVVIDENEIEETVIESTETVELNDDLVSKNELSSWVNLYGLNNLKTQAINGNSIAQRRLARYYTFVDTNNSEKIKWLIKASNQGDYKAIRNLAYSYFRGKGVQRNHNNALGMCNKVKNSSVKKLINSVGCYTFVNSIIEEE